MLSWIAQFNIFCLLDNHSYRLPSSSYEYIAAAGATDFVEVSDPGDADEFLSHHPDWTFGHISYDLSGKLFHLPPKEDRIGFPLLYFFRPRYLVFIKDQQLHIRAEDPDAMMQEIQDQNLIQPGPSTVKVQPAMSRAEYIEKIKSLQQHILRGDCYEVNFCMEFFAEDAIVQPAFLFQQLMAVSPTPYSAFYRCGDQYLVCASPERFLQKKGRRLISQPMKGTSRRFPRDTARDQDSVQELIGSAKERAENVMVVDLVRNDLSIVCERGSVKVDELFGIQSFPQVHQMVSTVSGILKEEAKFSDVLKATFPMGSMTGAPKHRVLQLIHEHEPSGRGIFSGAVGYFDPHGDFDFNVVIRSIMYNAAKKLLSYQVGSGITFYSDPEKEWEECLLKAEGIKKVLGQ